MAKLYETYPSLLKKAADPAQTPRKNIKHITDRFLGNARQIKKSNPSHCFYYLRNEFGRDLFPIVPFDSLLDLFVKTLERYPIKSVRKVRVPSSNTTATRVEKDMDGLELQLARTSLNTSVSAGEDVYPIAIREAIELAILGLPYVHVPFRSLSLDISPKVPRTKYTPYSAKPYQSVSPNAQCFFTSPYHAHLKDCYAEDKLVETTEHRMARPYDERELEWLEAFLKACDFMMKMNL
ncbi:hypothetical protein G7Y79_00061g093080 [Physcia stellaris]|nr:hypothetical protein G7Y79_00061g093080 [Physcia stellaris]